MFVAGVCCIKSKAVSFGDVLSDMLEMAKGVQNPMKGLFLRNYLGRVSTALPSSESLLTDEAKEITKHAIDFYLANLSESNKLWVRLHHGSKVDKSQREGRRKDLRLLVGTNLVRLSRLEGVTAEMYKNGIMPKVMEDILSNGDVLSQSYLMDCLIQVFPDDFHIYALEPFLKCILRLKEKVRVRMIMEALLHRLGEYVTKTPNAVPEGSSVTYLLETCVMHLIVELKDPNGLPDILHVQASLINFIGLCIPTHAQVERIGESLAACQIALQNRATIHPNDSISSPATASALESILYASLKVIWVHVLELRPFFELLNELPVANQRHLGAKILVSVTKTDQPLTNMAILGNLLSTIAPLLLDIPFEQSPDDIEADGDIDIGDLASRVAALIGIGCTPPIRYRLYCLARDRFFEGSAPFFVKTLVPLVFSALQLALELRHIELEPMVDEKLDPIPVPPVKAVEPTVVSDSMTCKDSLVDSAFDNLKEGVEEGKAFSVDSVESPVPIGNDGECLESTISPASPVVSEEEQTKALSPTSTADQENGKPLASDSSKAKEEDRPDSPPSLATIEGEQSHHNISLPPPPPVTNVAPQTNAKAVLEGITSRKIFQFTHEVVTGIALEVPVQALKLFLKCALAADMAHLQAIAYEFISQACILYEDEITPQSKDKLRSITYMVGTLRACCNFNADDYENLVTKVVQYASKLQNKSDQCHVVLLCSHLFYRSDIDKSQKEDGPYHDSERVLECLKRCLKLADACVSRSTSARSTSIFLEILHQYIYFLEEGCDAVTIKLIRTLVTLIRDRVGKITDPAKRHVMSIDVERRLSLSLYTLVQMRQEESKEQLGVEHGRRNELDELCT